MSVEVLEEKKVVRLPEVGEIWCHSLDDSIYLRIPDDQGLRIFGEGKKGTAFFSVSIETGYVCQTYIPCEELIILEPIGGVLKLQRKAVTE